MLLLTELEVHTRKHLFWQVHVHLISEQIFPVWTEISVNKSFIVCLPKQSSLRWTLRPGFHYTTNATTTTQKQSDYKVEQSSFTPIALFWLEIGRYRGRNWLNGNQALLR